MERPFVYMDYNATTPLHPLVKEQMVRDLEVFANASSMHEAGRRARDRVETARASVARLIGAPDPLTVYFTSGGSESNNTVFETARIAAPEAGKKRIITTAIEHPCVLESAKRLEEEGLEVLYLGVDGHGRIDMERLALELDPAGRGCEVFLVSVMAANNEIGTLEDIGSVTRLAKAAGALTHSDATQAAGKVPVDVIAWGLDYLTLSCHKLYGPKGVGALYVAKNAPAFALIHGGHQEKGVRAGTYNNLGILGFGLAADLALAELDDYGRRLSVLRERLRSGIVATVPQIHLNGDPEHCLPNTLNVSFPGAEGEAILLSLDLEGIEASTGSACASGSLEPSHVLMATGVGPELAHGSIRFSLGRGTTEAEVDYVIEKLPPIIKRLRRFSTVPSGVRIPGACGDGDGPGN